MSVKDFQGVPDLVKHVTMAIYGKLSGPQQVRIISAYKAACGTLQRTDFLEAGSEKGVPEHIHMTAKGAQRNLQHKGEHQAGRGKSAAFDNMAWILDQAYLEVKLPRNYEPSREKPKPADEIISDFAHHPKPVKRDEPRPPPKPQGWTTRVRAAGATFAKFAKAAFAKKAKRA
jgi:hypothetical protein